MQRAASAIHPTSSIHAIHVRRFIFFLSDISITGENFPVPYVPPEPEAPAEGEKAAAEGEEGAEPEAVPVEAHKVEAPSSFVRCQFREFSKFSFPLKMRYDKWLAD